MVDEEPEGYSIKMQILHASWFEHMKGNIDMGKIGMQGRAKVLREAANQIETQIQELKILEAKEANEQEEDDNSTD